MRRLFAVVVSTGLLFGVLAAIPAEPACGFAEPREQGWGSVRPLPPSRDNRTVSMGGEEYVGFSVGQKQGRGAAVVDSRTLQVTDDAGCSWDEAFAFGDDVDLTGDLEPSTSRFVDVAVSDREEGDERIVALVYDLEVAQHARVRTVVSDDGGRTFEVAGDGLPDALPLSSNFRGGCGDDLGCLLTIAPSDPDVVYVMVDGLDNELYVSRDGGRTFDLQNGDLVPLVSTESRDAFPTTLAVDPTSASTLWAGESFGTVLSSTNYGNTWIEHDLEEELGRVDGVRSVAVTASDLGTEVVAVVEVGNAVWTVHSDDQGRSWTMFESSIELTDDLAGAATAGGFIATTPDGAYRLDLDALDWVELGGESLGPLFDIHPLVNSSTVWFRGPGSLPVIGDLTFTPPPVQTGFDFDLPAFDPLNPQGPLPGRLQVPEELIQLDVGQAVSVPITLDLPQTPTQLDVFFLFDQSGSMNEEIQALARGMAEITNELIRRRIAIWVGLGGYAAGWRYQLHRDIGPPDAEFRLALQRMGTGGGNETVYTALHQIATGTGLPDSAAGFGPEPGWNAHWRGGAVRVVVNLTDERFQVESAGPGAETAVQALIDHRIKTVSLISAENVTVGSPSDPSLDSAVDENDMTFGDAATVARRTEALAGPSGVDCGGDGEIDIRPGQPLACYISPLLTTAEPAEQVDLLPNLADVVIEMLDGVTEVHTVEFQSDAPDVVTALTALDPVEVDIRKPQVIDVRATVTCPAHRAGTVIKPLVTAVASTAFLAADNLVVQCGAVPAAAAAASPVPPAVPQPAAVAAAPAPPPPPAPATVSAASTAGATSPAASSATMPQIGVAVAAQHERQVQTASIGGPPGSDVARDPDVAFEYSARRDSSPAPATLVLGAAMSVGAAAALARRRASAGRPGRVGVRR